MPFNLEGASRKGIALLAAMVTVGREHVGAVVRVAPAKAVRWKAPTNANILGRSEMEGMRLRFAWEKMGGCR